MSIGTPNFVAYARNIKRIYWAEFIDVQLRAARSQQFQASIVEEPYKNQHFIAGSYNISRGSDER